jgi:beta-barrel assembly-enhancing protease
MRRFIAVVTALAISLAGASAAFAQDDEAQLQQAEVKIGQQVYEQLRQKGEIIASSPYQAVLSPIAQQIKRVADRRYFRPFTFILVHEAQPNAFAVPGGNVYVTDSLMKFVENREELAGVLCHETAHDVHHDVVNNILKNQRAQRNVGIIAGLADLITGGKYSGLINVGANIDVLTTVQRYSREVESAADVTGSEICAEAGSNPWGMVWLFQHFEKAGSGAGMEMLSDHPTNEHRIAALREHFSQMPDLFARYSSNIARATPLRRPGGVSYSEPAR